MCKFTAAKCDQIAGRKRGFQQGLQAVLRCQNGYRSARRVTKCDEGVTSIKTWHCVAFNKSDMTEQLCGRCC